MKKAYRDMTPEERLEDRAAKNRANAAAVAPILRAQELLQAIKARRAVRKAARDLDKVLREETGEGLPRRIMEGL